MSINNESYYAWSVVSDPDPELLSTRPAFIASGTCTEYATALEQIKDTLADFRESSVESHHWTIHHYLHTDKITTRELVAEALNYRNPRHRGEHGDGSNTPLSDELLSPAFLPSHPQPWSLTVWLIGQGGPSTTHHDCHESVMDTLGYCQAVDTVVDYVIRLNGHLYAYSGRHTDTN